MMVIIFRVPTSSAANSSEFGILDSITIRYEAKKTQPHVISFLQMNYYHLDFFNITIFWVNT
jgi:hypothetical protein